MEFYDIESDMVDYDETDNYEEIFDNKTEIELDNLYDSAQKEQNLSRKIEQYENIINYEMSNSSERKFSFKSFEQLTLIYLENEKKEQFMFNFEKVLELRIQLDPKYSEETMKKIINVISKNYKFPGEIMYSLLNLLHKKLGTGTYYNQFLKYLQSLKRFITNDESLVHFPLQLFTKYIPDFLIYNYEVHLVNKNEKEKIIGGKKYVPAYGWTSYEFNIYNKYDKEDNSWLGCEGKEGEWINAYHGTARKSQSNREIMKIIDDIYKNNLSEGSGQQYYKSINCNEDTKNTYYYCGKGVYLTPNIQIAEQYAGRLFINQKYYAVVLLFKVNPTKLRIPFEKQDYWICEGSTDGVRPFRLLIKETYRLK